MKKKTYLIPLVLVVLGLLAPIVYAATHADQKHEPPSSASVQQSDEVAKAQDGDQNSKQNNQDEDQEPVSSEEKNEQSESTGTTTSNKGSQSNQSDVKKSSQFRL
jgi:cytoskeletal protein RodZ